MSKIKTIGIIGGLGPASTQLYYNKLIENVLKDAGTYPHLLINSIPMNELNAFFESKRYDEAVDYFTHQISLLQHAGAEITAIASNTPHLIIDRVKPKVTSDLISIVDVSVEAALKYSVNRVGLLGTGFTMKGGFFQRAFSKKGMLAFTPRSGHFQYINDKIYNELAKGIIKDETFEKFYEIVLELIETDKIEALILACTELSLLFKNKIPGLHTIDTAQAHIDAITRKALA